MVTFKSFLVAFSWFGMTQVTRKRVPTTWVPFYVKLDPQWRIQRRLSNKAKHRYNLGCLTTSSILLVLSFPTEAWTHFISNFFPCAWFQSQRPSSEWARRWSCSTDTRRGHHLSPPVAPPPLPEAPPPPPPVTLACALNGFICHCATLRVALFQRKWGNETTVTRSSFEGLLTACWLFWAWTAQRLAPFLVIVRWRFSACQLWQVLLMNDICMFVTSLLMQLSVKRLFFSFWAQKFCSFLLF